MKIILLQISKAAQMSLICNVHLKSHTEIGFSQVKKYIVNTNHLIMKLKNVIWNLIYLYCCSLVSLNCQVSASVAAWSPRGRPWETSWRGETTKYRNWRHNSKTNRTRQHRYMSAVCHCFEGQYRVMETMLFISERFCLIFAFKSLHLTMFYNSSDFCYSGYIHRKILTFISLWNHSCDIWNSGCSDCRPIMHKKQLFHSQNGTVW